MKDLANVWTCHCGKNSPERYHKGLVEAYYCPVCFKHKIAVSQCEHLDRRYVKTELENKAIQLREQCNMCNSLIGKAISQKDKDLSKFPLFRKSDFDKIESEYDIRWKISQRLVKREDDWLSGNKKQDYNKYINSPEWKELCQKILERDNWLCQSCLVNKADDVHHKTYAHFKNEPAFELVSVCRKCHQEIHGREF